MFNWFVLIEEKKFEEIVEFYEKTKEYLVEFNEEIIQEN